MIVLWLEILLPRHLSLSPLLFLRGLTVSSLVTFSLSYILIKLHFILELTADPVTDTGSQGDRASHGLPMGREHALHLFCNAA